MKKHLLKEPALAYSPTRSNFVATTKETFMRAIIRKVGNSRGIIIPAALISTCGFGDEVELSVDGQRLIIEVARTERRGWFEGYNPGEDPDLLAALPQDDGLEEWSW